MASLKLRCPRCDFFLSKETIKGHAVDHCFRCGGTFVEKGTEAKILGETSSQHYWRGTEIGKRKISYSACCPVDGEALVPYCVEYDNQSVEIDVCTACDGLWLDPKEGKILSDIVLHAGQDTVATFSETPGFKSYLFQLFSGMPVEAWNPIHHRPKVTLSLVCILIFLFFLQILTPGMTQTLALNPAQFYTGDHLWSLLTSGFVHSGIAHLLGNLYFLYIFGDNVEEHFGSLKFLALYLIALIVSALISLITHWGDYVLILGASGAISATLGAYMVLFPKVKLYMTWFFIPIRLKALWYLGLWFIFNAFMFAINIGEVAWEAHIAGFAVGALVAYFYRFKSIGEYLQES